jgi:Integrase core domain
MDLFVVPTLSFRLLYGFLVLRHRHRRIMWLGVTANPTAEWIARQLTEACGWEAAPDYVVRDRDCAYGEAFIRGLRAMGIRDRPTAPRSPWQNAYAERLIGSIRREVLDHVVVLGERHLRHLLRSYMTYHNEARTHLSLDKDTPIPREVKASAGSSQSHISADCITNTFASDFTIRTGNRNRLISRWLHGAPIFSNDSGSN